MSEMPRFGLMDLLMLFVVLGVAGGLRAGYVVTCCDGAKSSGPLSVQDARPVLTDFKAPEEMPGYPNPTDYQALIYNMKEHQSFSVLAPFADREEQTAHVAPGFPYLVGLLAQQIPSDKLEFTVRWIHVGLGSLAAGLYYLFARRAMRSLLVASLAGLFTAAHPMWIISTATMNDGVLATVALAWCLFLCTQAGEKGGALPSLLLGVSLGALPLVRGGFLPFAFVGLIWFLLRSRTLKGAWLCGVLSLLGFITALAPWTVRNFQVFNEPVPVVSSTYLHLWIGNNPEATGGAPTLKMMESAKSEGLTSAKQQERYASLGKEVKEEVEKNPLPTLRRRAYAATSFFVGERWLTEGTFAEWTAPPESQEAPAWLEKNYTMVLHGVMFGMYALAILGWRWTFAYAWESIPATLAMFWITLPYILGHAEGLSGPRLPLDGVLLCYAAFAIVALIPNIGGALLNPRPAQESEEQEA